MVASTPLERRNSVRGLKHRAAPALAVLAVVAGGAIWAGCGSSSTDSATDQANSVINQAQKQVNQGINKAQKQLNQANIPGKAQDKVNEANQKLNQAQNKVNQAAKQAQDQINNSGY
jgi:predicted PurR-regulated permease PerM